MPATPGLLDELGADEESGNGRLDPSRARSRVNLTKAAMIAVMHEFDRPMSSAELYAIWDGEKPLEVFEYHLLSLVMARVAEPVVTKAEILFQLVSDSEERNQKASKGAVPLALAGVKAHWPQGWAGNPSGR